jgi:uncharacterized glyoxalase superfamily protein PhnB
MTAASLRTGNYLSMERVIMAQAIPYLAFNGNCSEAMRFYERVLGLGAKLEMMMSGADSPMAAQIPKEHAHRILHARLRFDDGSYIYAGDTPVQMPYDGIRGATITMSYPSSAEPSASSRPSRKAERSPCLWAPCFGRGARACSPTNSAPPGPSMAR